MSEVISQVLSIPRSSIRPFPGQPRTYFDPKELEDLAASIDEIGQQTPIVVRKIIDDSQFGYELVDGERRYLACGLANVDKMIAWVKEVENSEEQFVSSVVANFGRVGHTPLEIAKAIEKIRTSARMADFTPGEQIKRIAKIFARSEPWVYQHLSILRLHPDVQAMMGPQIPEEERMSHSLGIFISSLHTELQLQIATAAVKQNMNLNQARIFARTTAEEAGHQAGTAKRRGPHDDFKMLESFSRRTIEGVSILMSPTVLEQLKKRRPSDLAAMSRTLAETAWKLDKLSKLILEAPVQPTASSTAPARPSAPSTRTVPVSVAAARVADIGTNGHMPDASGPSHEVRASEKQSLNISKLVFLTMFYHNNLPAVNLSRSRLMNMIQGDDGPEVMVKTAMQHAEQYWRKPQTGTDPEQKFIKLLHRFRNDFGQAQGLRESVTFAQRSDRSKDPVKIVELL